MNMCHPFVDISEDFFVKLFDMFRIILHLLLCDLTSFSESYDQWCWQSSRSESSLLPSSVDYRLKPDSGLSSDVKCSNSFRTIKFVPTYTHQVYFGLINIDWNFTYSLGGISMEKYSFLSTKLSDFINILNHTNFIVDIHSAYT